MSSSRDGFDALALGVTIAKVEFTVHLTDGRSITVPLVWFPRLLHGTTRERKNWQLIGSGEGIHWPDLDEDISVRNLLLGQPSAEVPKSLMNWLGNRRGKKN